MIPSLSQQIFPMASQGVVSAVQVIPSLSGVASNLATLGQDIPHVFNAITAHNGPVSFMAQNLTSFGIHGLGSVGSLFAPSVLMSSASTLVTGFAAPLIGTGFFIPPEVLFPMVTTAMGMGAATIMSFLVARTMRSLSDQLHGEKEGSSSSQNLSQPSPSSSPSSADAKEKTHCQKTEGADDEAGQMPPPIEEGDLSQEAMDQLDENLRGHMAGQVKESVFRKYLAPNTRFVLERIRRILPKKQFQKYQSPYTSGARMDNRLMIQDSIRVVPQGRIYQRRTAPGDVDVGVVVLSDTSGSISDTNEGVKTSLRTSAVLSFICEELNIDYGEIAFATNYFWLKPLGKKLGTEPLKSSLIERKEKALNEGGGTNIRGPMAEALTLLSDQNYQMKFLVLITDGAQWGDVVFGSTVPESLKNLTLPELRALSLDLGIHPLVVAIGKAADYVPAIFQPHEYRLSGYNDDIPNLIAQMMEEVRDRHLNVKHKPRKLRAVMNT